MRTKLPLLLLICAPLWAAVPDQERRITKLAENVYAIQHLRDGSGNTTVIIGSRQVLVVDSGYLPATAQEDIAQIRQWTNKPVAYVVNTHFHNDHNNGNRAYADAFPSVAIVAHEETKKDMDLIQPGNIERFPIQTGRTIAAFKEGKDGRGQVLSEEQLKQARELLPVLEKRVADFKALVYLSPTLTFRDRLDIDLGDREVQVLHLGRGNTPGDAVVYLPKERIIAAGDLVVYPIPYTFDGYPSEWIHTLERMAALDIQAIVPGHGRILNDKDYVNLIRDTMRSAVDQLRARIRQLGHPGFRTVDDVKGFVDLTPFRVKFAGDDQGLQVRFDQMAADLVRIAFNEAAQR